MHVKIFEASESKWGGKKGCSVDSQKDPDYLSEGTNPVNDVNLSPLLMQVPRETLNNSVNMFLYQYLNLILSSFIVLISIQQVP